MMVKAVMVESASKHRFDHTHSDTHPASKQRNEACETERHAAAANQLTRSKG